MPERAARLIHERKMGPTIFVFPDCFTALGGNQYVNSSAIGNYADYLTREIIPFVDREFRTLASREHRGCFGKSSGGYGAIIHGMKYAEYWGAIADHSGDAYFDFVYWHDWPNTLNELTKYRRPKRKAGPLRRARAAARRGLAEGLDDGRVKRFLDARLEEGKAFDRRGALHHEPVHGRDLRSGPEGAARLSPAVQPRDRRADRASAGSAGSSTIPILLVDTLQGEPGKSLAASTSTAAGATSTTSTTARASCRKRLASAGIAHTYEEFDDNHSDVDYRMDVSLPFLYRALKP